MTLSEHIPNSLHNTNATSAREYLGAMYDQPQYQHFLEFYTSYCRSPGQIPPTRLRNGRITSFPTFLTNGIAWEHRQLISLRRSNIPAVRDVNDYDQYLLMKLDIESGQSTEYVVDSITKNETTGDLFYYVGDSLQLNIIAHNHLNLDEESITLSVSNRGSRYSQSSNILAESLADIGSLDSDIEYDNRLAGRVLARMAIVDSATLDS